MSICPQTLHRHIAMEVHHKNSLNQSKTTVRNRSLNSEQGELERVTNAQAPPPKKAV